MTAPPDDDYTVRNINIYAGLGEPYGDNCIVSTISGPGGYSSSSSREDRNNFALLIAAGIREALEAAYPTTYVEVLITYHGDKEVSA